MGGRSGGRVSNSPTSTSPFRCVQCYHDNLADNFSIFGQLLRVYFVASLDNFFATSDDFLKISFVASLDSFVQHRTTFKN